MDRDGDAHRHRAGGQARLPPLPPPVHSRLRPFNRDLARNKNLRPFAYADDLDTMLNRIEEINAPAHRQLCTRLWIGKEPE